MRAAKPTQLQEREGLRLALPSKGRMAEDTLELLKARLVLGRLRSRVECGSVRNPPRCRAIFVLGMPGVAALCEHAAPSALGCDDVPRARRLACAGV